MRGTADLVIGIGAPDRGDDGVGWAVVDQLPERIPVYRTDGEPARLLEAWRAGQEVVIIDAVRSGSEPGSIFLFDATGGHLPVGLARSSHALGLAEAVELARALGALPRRLWVIGVEGKRFGVGEEMSPEVRRAIPRAAGIAAMLAASP